MHTISLNIFTRRIILSIALLLMGLQGFCQDYKNIQMVYIKGGSYFQGCDDHRYLTEEYDNEKPLHRVTLSSYYIGKFEFTLGQYRSLMGIRPIPYQGSDYGNKDCDNCPVVKLSWDEVMEVIKKLNEKTGKHYRLPTEAEWEFAARGGKYSKNLDYPGSNKLSEVAWFGKANGTTHPVGEKLANELSIFDMGGNVAEFCADWYASDYYGKTIDAIDPKGPAKGDKKVLRGGSYLESSTGCRSAGRAMAKPNLRQWDYGFRLAMDSN
jgi:sulfatase modifying factor 1